MTKIQKRPDFVYLLFLFAVGSIVGWCLEVVYRSIVSGCIIIPGFLLGPYCPIYGFGFVTVSYTHLTLPTILLV